MSGPGSDIFSLKSFKIFAESNFSCTFAIPKGKFTDNWCGSSVGLEYRPVTPGVASSSLVRTAETEFSHLARLRFLFCGRLERAAPGPPPSLRTKAVSNGRHPPPEGAADVPHLLIAGLTRDLLLPRRHSAKQPHMGTHQKPPDGLFLCARGRYRQVAHRCPSHTA